MVDLMLGPGLSVVLLTLMVLFLGRCYPVWPGWRSMMLIPAAWSAWLGDFVICLDAPLANRPVFFRAASLADDVGGASRV